MPHPFSLAFLTVFDAGPVEAIRIAAETGYNMVGLRLLPAGPAEAPYPLMTDDRLLEEAVVAIRDTGIAVADVEIVRLMPDTIVADFESFLERAGRLGARHVLVAGDDPDASRLTDNFAGLCQLAKTYSLTADLEFMPWTEVPDLAFARGIVEAAGEANGGVLIDALHLDRAGSMLEEVRGLPAKWINYVQFCDGPANYDGSDEGLIRVARQARLMPGDGAIDLTGLARAIPDNVTVSIEVPNHELASRMSPRERAKIALDATRRLLAAADDTRA
ncbi:sugar phosphate isomerase/epimerase [Mesorhizobium sp. J18]|uniref:sugar phosphate isomerase/epimerase family protein n=1 Tax=Mesorhizobium sp. J18 TaxID=935263 RepID=UPI00119C7537|nr:TIM barrel protein [Mesorhizobium sp. J18]TWG99502.1 sugar phosphate isomerase/epimerase [Mesorhizobium sp. J18]